MRSRRLALSALVLAAGAASALPLTASAGGRPLSTQLTGAAEVPAPGDPDGSGFARITLNQGRGEVCVNFEVADIEPVTGAHIHKAPAGAAGGVVVPLPVSGSGCVGADPALIKAIRQNPAEYYVNVHTAGFPGGALRGQLGK